MKTASGARLRDAYSSIQNSLCPTPNSLKCWDNINGYIGPAFTSPLSREASPSLFKDVNDLNNRHCFKLSPHDSVLTVNHAMTYLRLRDNGCTKEEAMHFSSKQRCRTDSTKVYDGPPGHRVMKRSSNFKEGPNWHGWQFHQARFDSDLKFKQFKPLEDNEDYEMLTKGYQNFQKRFKIVNGELVRQDNWEEKFPVD